MSDCWIENLVRMAGEAESLDRRITPVIARVPHAAFWQRRAAPLAGVAAAVLALCVLIPIQSRAPGLRGKTPFGETVNVCHLPGETRVERVSVDRLLPDHSESDWLLALVRSWNVDCQCLLWDVHKFADGGAVAVVRPGESLNLELDAAQSPAVEQVLVVAGAKDRRGLDGTTSADAVELLNCLNSRDIAAAGEHDSAGYASVVQSCLPQGVWVVSADIR